MLFVYTLADTLWFFYVLPLDVQRQHKDSIKTVVVVEKTDVLFFFSNWSDNINTYKEKEIKIYEFDFIKYFKYTEPLSTSIRVFVFVSDPLNVWDWST